MLIERKVVAVEPDGVTYHLVKPKAFYEALGKRKTPQGTGVRDTTIDGYRAVAALGVVFAHAVDYRFAGVAPHYAQKLADPLSQTSVDLFFVISGYIITTLLLKERERTRQISIASFYIRRACRIIPPLAAVLFTVSALRLADAHSLEMASTFTCNMGDCQWFTAHTWSLSVEEQFYLVWPMLLVMVNPRPAKILAATAILLLGFLVMPFAWHSNYISFACIGSGALYASAPNLRHSVEHYKSDGAWLAVAAFLVLAPLYLPLKFEAIIPATILFLLFATPHPVKRLLASRPIQVLGLCSYSIYLWQQLFLGRESTLSIWLFPVAVTGSVLLIERPFIRLGKRLSQPAAMGLAAR
ncbi:MAG TPA: acyltransferase [Sphingomicrobium sp.]|nr:acyltransferase [Sphingomicrobium sp.]